MLFVLSSARNWSNLIGETIYVELYPSLPGDSGEAVCFKADVPLRIDLLLCLQVEVQVWQGYWSALSPVQPMTDLGCIISLALRADATPCFDSLSPCAGGRYMGCISPILQCLLGLEEVVQGSSFFI